MDRKKKNWINIVKIRNNELRSALINAEGESAIGLSIGFPEYFLADNAQLQINKKEFKNIIKKFDKVKNVVELCKDVDIKFIKINVAGVCLGGVDGMPLKVQDGYFRSKNEHFTKIQYKNSEYMIIWKEEILLKKGSRQIMIIIPMMKENKIN